MVIEVLAAFTAGFVCENEAKKAGQLAVCGLLQLRWPF
jgi:hypothetical protein